VTELVKRYRRNAEKCLQLVQKFNDLEAKRSLLVMANAWLVLAAQREKTIEGAPRDELTFPVNEPPPREPPTPPIDEPQPPPIKEPPLKGPPPQRLDSAKPDDSMQS
jgi:hypothetical protein